MLAKVQYGQFLFTNRGIVVAPWNRLVAGGAGGEAEEILKSPNIKISGLVVMDIHPSFFQKILLQALRVLHGALTKRLIDYHLVDFESKKIKFTLLV